MSKVAAVLLNYNSTRYTRGCIRSLRSSRDKRDEQFIVVWDNHSSDPPTPETLKDCDLVLSETNHGFADGYNMAVAYALHKYHPDYLLILNNDTRVPKGMVRRLIQVSNKYQNNCLVAPKIYFEHGHEFHKGSYSREERGKVFWYTGGGIDWPNVLAFHRGVDEVDRGHFDQEEETSFVTGCCFLLTPKIWRKLRGFDKRYFLYFEDIDFSLRAKRKGLKLIYTPEAFLYHINAGSTGGGGSLTHQYYQTRNRLLFGLQYASLHTKLALLKEALRLWQGGSEGERLGVLHALEGRWGNQNKRIKPSVS